MKMRRGDRRCRGSLWRRLLSWILPERRDGWEQRARPVIVEPTDRHHSQALFYDSVVDRRKECGELDPEPAAPAVPEVVRPDAGEAAPVERERYLDGGIE